MDRINEGDSSELFYAMGLLREASMNVQKREVAPSSCKTHPSRKTEQFTFRINMEIKKMIAERAREENRSVSYVLNEMICEQLGLDFNEYY